MNPLTRILVPGRETNGLIATVAASGAANFEVAAGSLLGMANAQLTLPNAVSLIQFLRIVDQQIKRRICYSFGLPTITTPLVYHAQLFSGFTHLLTTTHSVITAPHHTTGALNDWKETLFPQHKAVVVIKNALQDSGMDVTKTAYSDFLKSDMSKQAFLALFSQLGIFEGVLDPIYLASLKTFGTDVLMSDLVYRKSWLSEGGSGVDETDLKQLQERLSAAERAATELNALKNEFVVYKDTTGTKLADAKTTISELNAVLAEQKRSSPESTVVAELKKEVAKVKAEAIVNKKTLDGALNANKVLTDLNATLTVTNKDLAAKVKQSTKGGGGTNVEGNLHDELDTFKRANVELESEKVKHLNKIKALEAELTQAYASLRSCTEANKNNGGSKKPPVTPDVVVEQNGKPVVDQQGKDGKDPKGDKGAKPKPESEFDKAARILREQKEKLMEENSDEPKSNGKGTTKPVVPNINAIENL